MALKLYGRKIVTMIMKPIAKIITTTNNARTTTNIIINSNKCMSLLLFI